MNHSKIVNKRNVALERLGKWGGGGEEVGKKYTGKLSTPSISVSQWRRRRRRGKWRRRKHKPNQTWTTEAFRH